MHDEVAAVESSMPLPDGRTQHPIRWCGTREQRPDFDPVSVIFPWDMTTLSRPIVERVCTARCGVDGAFEIIPRDHESSWTESSV